MKNSPLTAEYEPVLATQISKTRPGMAHFAATGPFGYVRLLGDRKAVDELTKNLDHIVIDRQDQIQADAEAIKLLAKRVPVLAFVKNHWLAWVSLKSESRSGSGSSLPLYLLGSSQL